MFPKQRGCSAKLAKSRSSARCCRHFGNISRPSVVAFHHTVVLDDVVAPLRLRLVLIDWGVCDYHILFGLSKKQSETVKHQKPDWVFFYQFLVKLVRLDLSRPILAVPTDELLDLPINWAVGRTRAILAVLTYWFSWVGVALDCDVRRSQDSYYMCSYPPQFGVSQPPHCLTVGFPQ